MTASAAFGEDADPCLSVSASETSVGRAGFPAGGSPSLVLSDTDRIREATWAAQIGLEHARVVGPVDSRLAAKYASGVVDRSRLLAGSDVRLHFASTA